LRRTNYWAPIFEWRESNTAEKLLGAHFQMREGVFNFAADGEEF
jgi:hypothetical protein